LYGDGTLITYGKLVLHIETPLFWYLQTLLTIIFSFHFAPICCTEFS
jgi:hypothetical protein